LTQVGVPVRVGGYVVTMKHALITVTTTGAIKALTGFYAAGGWEAGREVEAAFPDIAQYDVATAAGYRDYFLAVLEHAAKVLRQKP
jgi:hypothetical protein